MALTKCKECGAAVSTNATFCVGCGAKLGNGTSGCLIMSLILVFVFFVVFVVKAISGGGGSSSSRPSSIPSGKAPPQDINWGAGAAPTPPSAPTRAYMMVCLDTGERGISDSDPRIPRYQLALDLLGTRFKISETMICDQTWVVVEALRKQGVKTSGIEIMEGVVGMKEAGELGISYAEILASVMTIMQSKSAR